MLRGQKSSAFDKLAIECAQQLSIAKRGDTPKQRKLAAEQANALLPRLKRMVAAGARGGHQALWIASRNGEKEFVALLLRAKADPDTTAYDSSALIEACEAGHLEIARMLLEAGADPDFGEEVPPAIFYAIENNSAELLAELIRHDADVNVRSPFGPTPLLAATTRNQLDFMRALLDAGANPNLGGTVEILPPSRVYLYDGPPGIATVSNAPEALNVTPLIVATRRNLVDAAKILLDQDADPELKDQEGLTALAWACKLQHKQIEKLLCARGANQNVSTEGSLDNALLLAAEKGDLKRAKELLREGADPNAVIISAMEHKTPLCAAAKNGHLEILKLLLKAGADVEKTVGKRFEIYSVTPTMTAAAAGHSKVVEALLKANSNVAARDKSPFNGGGQTALHYAAGGGNRKVIQLLIAGGADPSVRDKSNITPLECAAAAGQVDAVDELLKHTTIRATNKKASRVLKTAVAAGHTEVVKRLLAANPDAHGNDPDFATVLAINAPLAMIRLFTKAGMRFDQKDSANHTPLQLARRYKRLEIAKFLAAHAK